MGRPLGPQVVARILELHAKGLSHPAIAERLGLSALGVQRVIKRKGKAAPPEPPQGKLISAREAQQAKGQHVRPCGDCPWARGALPGWLGSLTADEWLQVAHGEGSAECHSAHGARCAGLAIYRTNVGKRPRDPEALILPADRDACFSSPAEFKKHHEQGPEKEER